MFSGGGEKNCCWLRTSVLFSFRDHGTILEPQRVCQRLSTGFADLSAAQQKYNMSLNTSHVYSVKFSSTYIDKMEKEKVKVILIICFIQYIQIIILIFYTKSLTSDVYFVLTEHFNLN